MRMGSISRLLGFVLVLLGPQVAGATDSNIGDTSASSHEIQFCSGGTAPYTACAAADLRTKADALGSPVAIYEYLRNNYDYALYHGARSGAVNTFAGGRGNDVDLAATLISMLRSQGVPARYVVGTVRMPTTQVINWLAVKNSQLAIGLLRDQGIQKAVVNADGSTSFEHVWVEALIPYADYRGVGHSAINCATTPAACNWVPLDPSFKQRQTRSSGLDPYASLSFDYDSYYKAILNSDKSRKDKNPLEVYQNQVLTWLQTNAPGKTLDDIPDYMDLVAEQDGLLPASLPYALASGVRRYNSVKDHDDAVLTSAEPKNWNKYVSAKVQIGSPTPITVTGNVTASLVDAASKRLTLSWEPLASGYTGVFRLDGTAVGTAINASGAATVNATSMVLGAAVKVVLTMDGAPGPDAANPDSPITATYDSVIGGYYILATGGETSNWGQVHRAAQQLLNANQQYPIVYNAAEVGCVTATGMGCTPYVDTTGNGWDVSDTKLLDTKPAMDALTGGLLEVATQQYFTKSREKLAQLDAINRVRTPINGFLGMVSSTHSVQYLDGTAFSVEPGGLLIDMKGMTIAGSWRIDQPDQNLAYSNSHFELTGHILSALEHETWQELTGFDAISTVRGIQIALANNAKLVTPYRKSTSDDTLPAVYPDFGFGTNVPAGFTPHSYSLFGQSYQSWSYSGSDPNAGFEALLANSQGIAAGDYRLKPYPYLVSNNIDTFYSDTAGLIQQINTWQGQVGQLKSNVSFIGQDAALYTGHDVVSYTLDSSSPSGFAIASVTRTASDTYQILVNETAQHANGIYNVKAILSQANTSDTITRTFNYAPNSLGILSAPTAGLAGFQLTGYDVMANLTWTIKQTAPHPDGTYQVPIMYSGILIYNGTLNRNYSGQIATFTVQIAAGRVVDQLTGITLPVDTSDPNFQITCQGTTYTGTPAQLMTSFQGCFNSSLAVGNLTDFSNFFNSSSPKVYRLTASDARSATSVADIRDTLYQANTAVTWNSYRSPSKLSSGPNFSFNVDYLKETDTLTGNTHSASYLISNAQLPAAGGGYVTAMKTLIPALSIDPVSYSTPVTSVVVQPSFLNSTMTNLLTIAKANNDLIKTPSSNDPISTVTGNNFHDETDFTIKGRNGLHYVFTRTYNSAPSATQTDLGLGFGWVHSYGMRLKSNDFGNCPNCTAAQAAENGNSKTSSITYTDERGGDHNYLVNESTLAVTPPAGEYDSLVFNSPVAGQHTLTFRSGVKYIFETVGAGTLNTTPNLTARLKQIADPYGNQLNFTYNAAGRLATVTDNLGIAGRTGLVFAYDISNHLQSITDWTTRHWNYSVDANSHLASTTNPLNQTLSYAYSPGTHNLITVAKPLARSGTPVQTRFVYYQNGRTFSDANSLGDTEALDYDLFRSTTRITDPRGGIREYEYDNAGRLLRLTEADGAILQFSNNPDGLRNTKTDGLGYMTQYSYKADKTLNTPSDTFGNVTREQDALSQTVDTSYGIYDQVASVKDKRGTVATTSFHTTTDGTCKLLGKPDSVTISNLTQSGITTANVKLSSACWNADGSAASVTEYLDSSATTYRRTSSTYDSTAHLNVQQLTLTGSDGLSLARTFTYDTLGRKKTETLQRRTSPTNAALVALTTSYEYDALDRVTAVIDVYGNRMETVFDANGQVTQQIARYKKADGTFDTRILSTRTYDAADRLLTDTDTLGGITRYTYDEAGNLTTVTDPENHTTRFEYDAMNRRTAVIDGNDARITTDYDQAGHAIRLTNANGQTSTNTYDKLGRLTQTSDALGNITQMQYDANNNVTCVIDANAAAGLQPKNTDGCTVSTVYDELNRPVQSKDAQNRLTQTVYDLTGNVISLTDPKSRSTTYSYDTLGRLKQVTDPLAKTTTMLRDEAGNAYQVTNRLAEVTNITYDALNRASRSDYLKDNTAQTTTYSIYGTVIAQANNTLNYAFSYDALNRLKTKSDSRGRSLAFNYDKSGRLLSKSTYQNSTTTYTYDGTGKLAAITNPDYLNVNYQFDGAGRLLSRIMSSGAKSLYQYDANGQLTHLTHTNASGGTLTDIAYTRDHVGNILTQTDSSPGNPNAGITTFSYDALYRLISADAPGTVNDEAYSYDEAGNRLTATKGGITLGAVGSSTRYYDILANSNRLSQIHLGSATGTIESAFIYDNEGRLTSQSGSTPRTLTWDAKGRLKTLTQAGTTETYSYDPTDHRIQRTGGTLGNLDYYLEGEHLESVEQNGSLKEKYFRGASIDELVAGYIPISASNSALTPVLFQQDATMSTSAISEPNGGTVQTQTFSAFGASQSSTGASTSRLKYTGREEDGTGLYYYRARYYDPTIGRFLSEDPLQFQAGINFYAYVGNNPVNANDPTGELAFLPALYTAIETAPEWGPALLTAGRAAGPALLTAGKAAVTAIASWARSNAGLVAGSIGGGSGAAGYYTTTSNPNLRDAGIATGLGVAQGLGTLYLPGAGTFKQGALIGAGGDAISQAIGIGADSNKSFNLGELAGATLGGGATTKLTRLFGSTWSQQASAATIAWPVSTAATAVGQKLGDTPSSASFNNLDSGLSFQLYPNRSNNNLLQSPYGKPPR